MKFRTGLIVLYVAAVTACSTTPSQPPIPDSAPTSPTPMPSAVAEEPQTLNDEPPAPPEPTDRDDGIWKTIRNGMQIEFPIDDERINELAQGFVRSRMLEQLATGPRRHLFAHVTAEVLKRDLPTELIFLPFIESEFTPGANYAGNVGMWQIIESTGRGLGLQVNDEVDERLDPVRASAAGLDYMERLSKVFDGDWMLALVGYNLGDGALKRILATTTERDCWKLPLPRNRTHHINKLAAIWLIVRNPDRFNYQLPAVQTPLVLRTVSLPSNRTWASLGEHFAMSVDDLRFLNPGVGDEKTATKGQHLWIPSREPLVALNPDQYFEYKIRSGDNLWTIARRFATTISELRSLNGLDGDRLQIGKTLRVPAAQVGG